MIDPFVLDGCDSRDLSSILLSFLSRWELSATNLDVILLGNLPLPQLQVLRLLGGKIHNLALSDLEASLAHLTEVTVFSFDQDSFQFLDQQSGLNAKYFDVMSFISGINGTLTTSPGSPRFGEYDLLLFRKASETEPKRHCHKVFKSTSYYTYISGYSPVRPEIETESQLIGPRWQWMMGLDCCISGVNFVGVLLDAINVDRKQSKNFNAIYIGSSSLNKNAVFAYFILLVSRIYALALGRSVKPDIFLVTKFYGFKGALIWQGLRLLRIINNLFCVNISFRMISSERLSHKGLAELIGSADYGLVLYLREGYPRVIGEFLEMGAEPIVWSGLNFGNLDFLVDNNQYRIRDIIRILSGRNLKILLNKPLLDHRCLLLRQKLIETLDGSTLRKVITQLNQLPEKKRVSFLYVMLTNDISWIQEM